MANYGFHVFWSNEDQAYVADSVEFAGISGIGPDAETALTEARVALELAIETH